MPAARRRWRFYRTSTGLTPVRDFLDSLSDADTASVAAAMRGVAADGLVAARHLVGEIYEVRADGARQTYRVLFASEGRRAQVLLALEGFSKKTQRTPATQIALAQRRLADWRRRGRLSHV
jgi:phage-related protein